MRQPAEPRHLRTHDRVPSSRWLGLYAVFGGLLLASGVSVTGAGAFFDVAEDAATTSTTTTVPSTASTTTSTTVSSTTSRTSTTVPPEEVVEAIGAVEGGPDEAPAEP